MENTVFKWVIARKTGQNKKKCKRCGETIKEGDNVLFHFKIDAEKKTMSRILGIYCNKVECGTRISHELFFGNEALKDPIRNDWGLDWGLHPRSGGTNEAPHDLWRPENETT